MVHVSTSTLNASHGSSTSAGVVRRMDVHPRGVRRSSRERGGGSELEIPVVVLSHFFPRAWGWFSGGGLSWGTTCVLPANAGVVRSGRRAVPVRRGSSRERGGGSVCLAQYGCRPPRSARAYSATSSQLTHPATIPLDARPCTVPPPRMGSFTSASRPTLDSATRRPPKG